jgi:hypothetical protein
MAQSHDNHNSGVMVIMLASSAVDPGLELRSGQTKDYTLRRRAKTGWFGIRVMCPSGATCLPTDCCFSELAL